MLVCDSTRAGDGPLSSWMGSKPCDTLSRRSVGELQESTRTARHHHLSGCFNARRFVRERHEADGLPGDESGDREASSLSGVTATDRGPAAFARVVVLEDQSMKPRRRVPLLITLIVVDLIAILHLLINASVGAGYDRAMIRQLTAEGNPDLLLRYLEASSSSFANVQFICIAVLLANVVALAFVVDSDRSLVARDRAGRERSSAS